MTTIVRDKAAKDQDLLPTDARARSMPPLAGGKDLGRDTDRQEDYPAPANKVTD